VLSKASRVRITFTIVYFVATFTYLLLDNQGNSFCSRPGGYGPAVAAACFALACTVWDSFASLCGALAVRSTALRLPALAIPVSAVIAAAGLLWIALRGGPGLFGDTWADVSCLFTEGYGFMFLFLNVPILVAFTVVREWMVWKKVSRMQSRK
jgi:hypothetical protein